MMRKDPSKSRKHKIITENEKLFFSPELRSRKEKRRDASRRISRILKILFDRSKDKFSYNMVVCVSHDFRHTSKNPIYTWFNPTVISDIIISYLTWTHNMYEDHENDDKPPEFVKIENLQTRKYLKVYIKFDKSSGKIVSTYGYPNFGSDLSVVREKLDQVKLTEIVATFNAFCGLTIEGRVITWGHNDYGGDCSGVKKKLKGCKIKCVYSTEGAFCGLTEDGQIITWGAHNFGGDCSSVKRTLKDAKIRCVYSAERSFCGLTEGGQVVVWGDIDYGGHDGSPSWLDGMNVQKVESGDYCFKFTTKDGTFEWKGTDTEIPKDVKEFSPMTLLYGMGQNHSFFQRVVDRFVGTDCDLTTHDYFNVLEKCIKDFPDITSGSLLSKLGYWKVHLECRLFLPGSDRILIGSDRSDFDEDQVTAQGVQIRFGWEGRPRDTIEGNIMKAPFKGLTRTMFLELLVDQQNHDLCKNTHINDVKQLLWKEVRWIFHIMMILYAGLYVTFVMMCVNITDKDPCDNLSVVMAVLTLNFFSTLVELRHFYRVKDYGFKARFMSHFGDVWNIMDFLVLTLIYGTVLCYCIGVEHQILRVITGVSLFMSTFNLLYYLRGSDEVSLVVTIMGNIFFNIWSFMLILTTLLLGFSLVFYVLDTEDSFYGFFDVFLFTFRMGVLGDTDQFDLLESSTSSVFAKILFVCLQVCSTITMLNALISHMGDIYDKVREKSLGYQAYERIKLCLELMKFIPDRWRKDIEKRNVYIYSIEPLNYSEEKNEWQGHLASIQRVVKNETSTLNGQVSDIMHALQEKVFDVETKVFDVESKISGIETKITNVE
eukprot:UN25039